MLAMTPELVGVGSPLVDLLLEVDDDFVEREAGGGKGGMHLLEPAELDALLAAARKEPTTVAGGAASNTVVGCANLGIASAFIGSCGHDELADFYRAALEEQGCRPMLDPHDELPTGRVLCLITPDAQRTMRTALGAAAAADPRSFTPERFAGARLVMMEGYVLFNHALAFAVVEAARAAGCEVALDLASFEVVEANRVVLEELLEGRVDLVFGNEDEARAWKGSVHDALDDLAGRARVAAIKTGEEGAWIACGDERHHVPAEQVTALDTTGAGDCWAAGFLAGYLRGLPLARCGYMGALAGAAVVQVTGARAPADQWRRIRGYLEAWV